MKCRQLLGGPDLSQGSAAGWSATTAATSAAPVTVCPECGSLDVGYSGFGTEKIEEELARLFPDLTVRRIDTDAVRHKGALRRPADRVPRRAGSTSWWAPRWWPRGSNFPGVKLVGVVLADTGLQPAGLPGRGAHLRPDRAGVRQGRQVPSGRHGGGADLPARTRTIALAAQGKLEEFYAAELENRPNAGFPPVHAPDPPGLPLAKRGQSPAGGGGFQPAPAGRGRSGGAGARGVPPGGDRRQQPHPGAAARRRVRRVHAAAHRALRAFSPPAGVYLEVDVDPVSLL